MSSRKDFYSAVESRRSIYNISKESIIPDEKIIAIISHCVKHTPSAFNSQNGRVAILLGENHNELWNITKGALRKKVPENRFPATEKKINSFVNGYGTILFFEDMSKVQELQEKFPSYAKNFPMWSQQSIGMLQYLVWTSLELEGFGASLQHYNPLIDDDVKKRWNIKDEWRLVSQMPFGKLLEPAGEKEYVPLEERVKIFVE